MSKIGLIIEREYLTRVRQRSFVLMTLFIPVLFGLAIMVPVWLSKAEPMGNKEVGIIFRDAPPFMVESTPELKFTDVESERVEVGNGAMDAIVMIKGDLLLHPEAIEIYSQHAISKELEEAVEKKVKSGYRRARMAALGVPEVDELYQNLENLKLDPKNIQMEGNQTEATDSTMAISLAGAMLIYFFIFMYGTQVMRGVTEEKTNRIVEVIITSVKPIELMFGKIIGIGLVAFTQFVAWVVLTMVTVSVLMPDNAETASMMGQTLNQNGMGMFFSLHHLGLLGLFVLFFVGGYMLYAALFAAIGAAVDSQTDTQQFMFPVTLPLIVAVYIAMMVLRNPDSATAYWASFIPFTAPIVMMARIPYHVSWMELVASLGLLYAMVLLVILLAAKIYRVGILMYGKKASYQDLWMWLKW